MATVAMVAVTAVFAAACGEHGAQPMAAPSDVHLATGGPAQPIASSAGGSTSVAAPGLSFGTASRASGTASAADRLAAARTVMRYCALVDDGQFARAAELCARRRFWSRRALASLTRFHFHSARIYATPDARTLVLKARVRVRVSRGRPWPDGLSVLFFTLGRAGTAVGGWLITAVSTSP
jgi:hypothetical protein